MRKAIGPVLSTLFAVGALAGSTAGAAPAKGGSDLKLYVFDCGVLLYNSPERFGYKPGEVSPTNLSDGCYLIDDPGKGTMVWDTGVVPDRMWNPNGGPPPKKEYGEAVKPLNAQMAAAGYKPEDITYIAVSHMHWDHVANLYQFGKSTWLASAYTRDKLLSDEKGDKIDPSMFTALKTSKIEVMPDDKDFDVFGDGKVIRIPTPGHTPDSAVLLVKLKNHKPVILAGDLYHFHKDIARNHVTRGEDEAALKRGRARVADLIRTLKAELWIPHDWNDFAAVKKSPAFYD